MVEIETQKASPASRKAHSPKHSQTRSTFLIRYIPIYSNLTHLSRLSKHINCRRSPPLSSSIPSSTAFVENKAKRGCRKRTNTRSDIATPIRLY